MTASASTAEGLGTRSETLAGYARRNGWGVGLLLFLGFLLIFTKVIQPNYSFTSLQFLAAAVLPLAFAAVAQAIIVMGGGIDLSIASMMALTSVVSAMLMKGQSQEFGVAVVAGVLLLGLFLGAVNGTLVVLTRVPDIIVTLSTFFVWAGFALLVLPTPGGSASPWLRELVTGSLLLPFIPKAAVVLFVIVSLVWLPLRRSRTGLSIYAIGSQKLAAFRSGVPVGRTKIISYAIGGFFAALGGLALTATTSIGSPVPEPTYTLISVAAVVLGGVSLAGGVGGVLGPILAVIVLQLIRTDMTFLGFDPNLALVTQGFILIGVLVMGSWIQIRRSQT